MQKMVNQANPIKTLLLNQETLRQLTQPENPPREHFIATLVNCPHTKQISDCVFLTNVIGCCL